MCIKVDGAGISIRSDGNAGVFIPNDKGNGDNLSSEYGDKYSRLSPG